jgi:predicted metal-dependent enzyme (double-stranded beta helix superfamily)
MARSQAGSRSAKSQDDDALLELLLRLDRLEELIEEMDEQGVTTRAEAENRMEELHKVVDELEID